MKVSSDELKWPCIPSPVLHTSRGTPYLQNPGVALISQPAVNVDTIEDFLKGFDDGLGFPAYLEDPPCDDQATTLVKTAGQLCYMSFGPQRTLNQDASKYLSNIKKSGHGSVLEHPNYSFLCYGIDRAVTHEVVRHRAGFGFSQVSQRYVAGKVLRFVESQEYVGDSLLHSTFERWIDEAAEEYERRTDRLLKLQDCAEDILLGDTKTDRRKKVQQAARRCLPNETEAPIVITANARGWRHFIEMRASEHADIAIRSLAYKIYTCLRDVSPVIFEDYQNIRCEDGLPAVVNEWRKV